MLSSVRQIARRGFRKVAPYPFERPVFIIAPPRSGSTFLFECLSKCADVYHLNYEADGIWWKLFPYDRAPHRSDLVNPEEMTPELLDCLRQEMYEKAIRAAQKRGEQPQWAKRLGIKPIRYLDKTIANCFHLDVLQMAFPRARYVFLVRDPRANISSMIEGWPHLSRFGKPQLNRVVQDIPGATVDHWTYPAPPGWQEVVSLPLAKICAWSWEQHIRYALDFFQQSDVEVKHVCYEDLRDSPSQVVANLARQLDLDLLATAQSFLRAPTTSRTTVSDPEKGKWKRKNYDTIQSILPEVRDTAKLIGYDI